MTSLACALLAAGCVAGAAWASPLIGPVAGVVFALFAVTFVGGGLWYIAGVYDRELSRLLTRLDSAGDKALNQTPLRSRFALDEVLAKVCANESHLRQKLAELVASRRALEIATSVADADRQHLQTILNSISDAVIVTDAFNEVAIANGAAGRILGFDATRAARRPMDQVFHDPLLLNLIRETREADATTRRCIDHTISFGPEQAATFNVCLSPIAVNGSGVGGSTPERAGGAGVVTVLRDITREREIADAKNDFVANVSHELRTPLSSIKAYMEMLVDGEANSDETRAEFYNVIQGEANRLSRLIDNVLNISRIESGVFKVQREALALSELARETVDILMPQANARRIVVQLEPPASPIHVFADRDMMLQTMLNLVGNAIKYTREGGEVRVFFTCDRAAGEVTFAVSDNGVGIPEVDLPHIFDKFYRVADHKGMAKGTGLGLSLVKYVIESIHAGRVGLTSKVGTGSTFTFTLPIAESDTGQ